MRRGWHAALIAMTLSVAPRGLAVAQAPAPAPVHIRCRISVPSGVTEPLTMAAQVYRVSRDASGTYQVVGSSQNLIVALSPGEVGTAAGRFEMDLEPGDGIDYEFKVVPLDADGYERTDGRYYFAGPADKGDVYDNAVTLVPGKINEVVLNLRWVPRTQQTKSNFLRIAPRPGRGDYVLILSVNDATGINLMN
jgi:hypothetical protein